MAPDRAFWKKTLAGMGYAHDFEGKVIRSLREFPAKPKFEEKSD
jgi:hypothetical protein